LFEALEEVRTAAAALKKNPGHGEIQLKPNNSFIRRQQHSLAVEMGFDTESRGEGKDRGVVLRMTQA
jgi:predicted RNA-binding protein Jag